MVRDIARCSFPNFREIGNQPSIGFVDFRFANCKDESVAGTTLPEQITIGQVPQQIARIITVEPDMFPQFLDRHTTKPLSDSQGDLLLSRTSWRHGGQPLRNLWVENSEAIQGDGEFTNPRIELWLRQTVAFHTLTPVSYTHLTLPTIYSV